MMEERRLREFGFKFITVCTGGDAGDTVVIEGDGREVFAGSC